MRILRDLTVGMLALIAVAACATFPELEGAGVAPEATTRPVAVTARIQSQENVATRLWSFLQGKSLPKRQMTVTRILFGIHCGFHHSGSQFRLVTYIL